MSTIDHKDAAEKLLHFEDQTSDVSLARDAVQVAQAHATLYLAGQQRIANLQRYAEGLWVSWEKDAATTEERGALEVEAFRVGAIVREGLGL